jgi:hypothetical protein
VLLVATLATLGGGCAASRGITKLAEPILVSHATGTWVCSPPSPGLSLQVVIASNGTFTMTFLDLPNAATARAVDGRWILDSAGIHVQFVGGAPNPIDVLNPALRTPAALAVTAAHVTAGQQPTEILHIHRQGNDKVTFSADLAGSGTPGQAWTCSRR